MNNNYFWKRQKHAMITILVFYVLLIYATQEDVNEYWYSSDDGYISFAANSLEKHYNGNASIELGNINNYKKSKNSSDSKTYKKTLRLEQNNEVIKKLDNNITLIKVTQGKIENEAVSSVYPNDDGICVAGTILEDECSICSCSGGQLYICRLKPCKANKFKPNCVEGKLFNPMGVRNCENCMCIADQLSFCFLGVCKKDKKTNKLKMHCEKDLELQIGELHSCKTCQCINKKLSCEVTRKRCHGLASTECTPGTLSRYADKPCTMCYCYNSKDQICVKDAACNRKVKQKLQWLDLQHCNGGNCIEHCYNSDLNKKQIGVCIPARVGGQKCECL